MEITTIDKNQLRKFGFILTFFFFGIFGFFLPFLQHRIVPLWPWIIGFTIFVPTLIKPNALKIVYIPWMKLGNCLGWINTRIILGIIFFMLITPFGIFIRLLGKDLLSKRFDQSKKSYRKISSSQSIQHMERPF